jgi:predicted secreted hydrolase
MSASHAVGTSSSDASEPDLLSAFADISSEDLGAPFPDWKLTLPEDHGAHAISRTEIWQVATHLRNEDGEDLGFQLSFMRLGVASPTAPPPKSIWEVRELYRGHITFVEAASESALAEERFGRGIPKLAGYDTDSGELRLDNWFLQFGSDQAGDRWTLYATLKDKVVVELVMRSEKPALALDPNGTDPLFVGYSITRFAVEGTVDQGSGKETVMGTAWFDHLWGELPLSGAGPVASDRLQFQLEDGTDISVIRSRRTDGKGAPALNGFIVAPDGTASLLGDENLKMTASRTWTHPKTGASYPIEWRLTGPNFDMTITSLIDEQVHDFAVPLWSGIVHARGKHDGTAVSGVGTLQLTGYTNQ